MLGSVLIFISFAFYFIQFVLFSDMRNTVFYFLQDMAFVPIQVILVSLVLDQIISRREKQEKLKKINIVISAFFTEMGTSLIRTLSEFNLNFYELKTRMVINSDYEDEDFNKLLKIVDTFDFTVDSRKGDLIHFSSYMTDKKGYILGMFENPSLLEHDAFTDMLWAVFHIIDELDNRERLNELPDSDLDHLSGDIKRALKLLVTEWVFYMKHLKKEYPYLFSLAARKNPFCEECRVIISE